MDEGRATGAQTLEFACGLLQDGKRSKYIPCSLLKKHMSELDDKGPVESVREALGQFVRGELRLV